MATAAAAASSDWMPPSHGREHVNIGSSLSRYLRARQGKPAPNKKPGMPDRDFYAFRYNFKPAGVDDSQEGSFVRSKTSDTPSVKVELPGQSKGTAHRFQGTETPAKEVECVLIYDPEQGTFVLEKLEASMSLTHELGSHRNSQSSVPFQEDLASAYAGLSDTDAPGEPDVPEVEPPIVTKPLPKIKKTKSKQPVKYEEEEEGEIDDVPLKTVVQARKRASMPNRPVASLPSKPTASSSKPPPPPPKQTATKAPPAKTGPSKPTPSATKAKRPLKRPSSAVESIPSDTPPVASKPAKRARPSQPLPPRPTPKPKVAEPPKTMELALPGSSSTNTYATPLPAPSSSSTSAFASSSKPTVPTPTPAPTLASVPIPPPPPTSASVPVPTPMPMVGVEDDDDDEDDWDEVSPEIPQTSTLPLPPPPTTGASHTIVMEEDFGDSPNSAFAPPSPDSHTQNPYDVSILQHQQGQGQGHHEDQDEDIDALFEAEFENQTEDGEGEGEGDEDLDMDMDFLAAAVSPVLENVSLGAMGGGGGGGVGCGPISLHKFAASAEGEDIPSDDEFSSSDDSDDD